jgi:co-chaperonin GroES (HSP10)
MTLSAEAVVPQPGWIFVQRKQAAKTTPGGLHIPETARTKNRGITPGESQSVTVIAVSPDDQKLAVENGGTVYAHDIGAVRLPAPGSTVFVLAQPDNLVPVWDSDWGLVERENGFAVPDFYLFKLSALAGTVKEVV